MSASRHKCQQRDWRGRLLLWMSPVMLSSCAHLYEKVSERRSQRADAVVRESRATGRCTIHHTRLEKTTIYISKGCILVSPQVDEILDRFPNALPVCCTLT